MSAGAGAGSPGSPAVFALNAVSPGSGSSPEEPRTKRRKGSEDDETIMERKAAAEAARLAAAEPNKPTRPVEGYAPSHPTSPDIVNAETHAGYSVRLIENSEAGEKLFTKLQPRIAESQAEGSTYPDGKPRASCYAEPSDTFEDRTPQRLKTGNEQRDYCAIQPVAGVIGYCRVTFNPNLILYHKVPGGGGLWDRRVMIALVNSSCSFTLSSDYIAGSAEKTVRAFFTENLPAFKSAGVPSVGKYIKQEVSRQLSAEFGVDQVILISEAFEEALDQHKKNGAKVFSEVGYGILENLVTEHGFDAEDAINHSGYFLEKKLHDVDGLIYTVFPPGAAAGGGRRRRRIRNHKTMRKRRSYRRRRVRGTRR